MLVAHRQEKGEPNFSLRIFIVSSLSKSVKIKLGLEVKNLKLSSVIFILQ